MKLRLRDDSLRLRLTRSEVDAFAKDGRVASRVRFGDKTLVYALAHASVDRVSARLANDEILVTVPSSAARAWASSEEVGISANDGVLRVLVEKDFACLKPREGEDDADAFPHPDPKKC
jgi:hypothetical protein